MKKLSIILFSLFTLSTVFAQQRVGQRMNTVNINVYGNKNTQVAIDGNVYNLTNASSTVSKAILSNLVVGMHTLTLTRTNNNNNNRRANDVTTQFNLRRNFDMTINVNANGSLELIETRKGGGTATVPGTSRTAMSDVDYNTLSRSLRTQTTTPGRYIFLTNTFSNTNYYFTSRQIAQLLQQVRTEPERLQLAKLAYRTVVDPANYTQVSAILTTQARKDELDDYVYYYEEDAGGTGTGTGSGTVTPGTNMGMSETSFNALYTTIQGQWPVTTQVNSINSAFANTGNYFTAYQAGRLIQLVTNEAYRLQLAKASYRSIVDPSNFYTIRDLLYSQSSRTELEAYVSSGGQVGTGNTIRTAMSDTDYNTLYDSINSQFLPFAQMTSLTNTFNNTSYYFTTAQAKKLIQLVSSETNRLQLSKSVYRNIVDRANFSQLYDLFTSQTYVNDLNAYVQAYRD